jgi:hypothetical protein
MTSGLRISLGLGPQKVCDHKRQYNPRSDIELPAPASVVCSMLGAQRGAAQAVARVSHRSARLVIVRASAQTAVKPQKTAMAPGSIKEVSKQSPLVLDIM